MIIKLKPKQVLFYEVTILFIVTVLSCIGLFLRTNLFAYDSYAFLSYANGFFPSFGVGHDLVFVFIDFLPKSLVVYDFVMFSCLFLALCGLYYGLKPIYGKVVSGVTLLVVLAASPVLIFDFAQFQNELFAYPFIFLSFCFLMRKKNVEALVCALVGCVFWLGSFVWIGIVAVGLVIPFFIVVLLGLPFLWSKVGWAFGFIDGVAFNTLFWGLFDFWLLFPFVFVLFWQKNRQWQVWMIVSLVCVCLSARFVILAVPFIALGVAYSIKNWLIPRFGVKKVVLVCVFLILGWNIALFLQHPSQNELVLVERFVFDCKDSNVICFNDWSLGWWVTAKGGVTSFKAGPPNPDYNVIAKPFLALTSSSLDCNLLEYQGIVNYYNCS